MEMREGGVDKGRDSAKTRRRTRTLHIKRCPLGSSCTSRGEVVKFLQCHRALGFPGYLSVSIRTRNFKMQQSTILAVSFGVLAALLTCSSAVVSVETTNLCPPDASPKMRQLCLLASLEQYLAENPPRPNADVLDTQLYDRGTKRQDVDHVFLRFGRRLGL